MASRLSPHKILFPVAIFFGAFLLFWLELILGKYLLPWFGGTPAVWTTCMLFFQMALLGGYIYAHFLSSRASVTAQVSLHCLLLFAAVAQLAYLATRWSSPLTPSAAWKPVTQQAPALHVIGLLAVAAGIPCLLLSSTGPLLQHWYKRSVAGNSPYRLYSLSNLASFLAIFAFPLFLEPRLPLKSQGRVWALAYLFYCGACAGCARLLAIASRFQRETKFGPSNPQTQAAGSDLATLNLPNYLLWFAFSACASVVFLATTNQLCQEIASVPLLWVLPLAVYLLSFILCFEHERWYARNYFHLTFGFALFAACFLLYDGALNRILTQASVYLLVLFIVCMVCHGELVRLKPHPNFLTSFYLVIAAGGAFGGIFVSLLAPQLFSGFWEYQVGLWTAALLLLYSLLREPGSWLYQSSFPAPILLIAAAILLPEAVVLARPGPHPPLEHLPVFFAAFFALYVFLNRKRSAPEPARSKAAPACSVAALLVVALVLGGSAVAHTRRSLARFRNFYGTLAITLQDADDPARSAISLLHGGVSHGFQSRSPAYRRSPTAYFSRNSGIGLAIEQAMSSDVHWQPLRFGIVGLGIGTIAAYGRPGDIIRFYEINPKVIEIASNPSYFTYLSDSPAAIRIIPGDARLSLEGESEPQNFDVLVVDAFSGDSIPVHLLTEECLRLYLRHLRQPGGILAMHITNTYLDLRPVLLSAAERFHLAAVWVHCNSDNLLTKESDWILLSREPLSLDSRAATVADLRHIPLPHVRPWTDDYSNLLQILRK